jgi:hypothetical protein
LVACRAAAGVPAHLPLPATAFTGCKLHVWGGFLPSENLPENRKDDNNSNSNANHKKQILHSIIAENYRVHHLAPSSKSGTILFFIESTDPATFISQFSGLKRKMSIRNGNIHHMPFYRRIGDCCNDILAFAQKFLVSVRPEIVDFDFPMRFSGSVFATTPKKTRDLRQA